MKFTIKRQILLKLLNFTGQVPPSKSSDFKYLSYNLCIADGKLKVATLNDSISCECCQPFKSEDGKDIVINPEEGSIYVDAKGFQTACSSMVSDVLTIETIEDKLSISGDSSDCNFNIAKCDEYPDFDIDKDDKVNTITLNAVDLKKLFDTTIISVATKTEKECLKGINVKVRNNAVYFSSSDATRMSMYAVNIDNPDASFEFNCPIQPLKILLSSCESGQVTINLNGPKAVFKFDNSTIVTNLYSSDFPLIENVIPKDSDIAYDVCLNRKQFLEEANYLEAVANSKGDLPRVKFSIFSDNTVRIESASTSIWNGKVNKLKAKYVRMPENCEVVVVSFNLSYLFDALKTFTGVDMNIKFKSPNNLLKVVDGADKANIQVIAPVRLG